MPIYEYQCTYCALRFEKLMKLNADNPKCEDCASDTKKSVSRGSFILKGDGWYRDGYGLKKGKKND